MQRYKNIPIKTTNGYLFFKHSKNSNFLRSSRNRFGIDIKYNFLLTKLYLIKIERFYDTSEL